MRVTIRLFARLRELAGAGELAREVPTGATVNGVWQGLVRDFPAMAPYEASLSCAVNAEYARFKTTVNEGDEIAFLPPVSGG
jgi:molybdopterin converting factor subunit 1